MLHHPFFTNLRVLLALLFLCTTPCVQAQDRKGSISTGEDTLLVKQLMHEAAIARSTDPDTAIALLRRSIHISRTLQYNEGIAGALLSLAFCYQDKGDYNKTKELLVIAYPYCVKAAAQHNKRILPSLYNGWGGTYSLQGDNDSALHYFYKALAETEKNGSTDATLQAQIYSNMGSTWMQRKQPEKALQYLRKAEDIASGSNDTVVLGDIYINTGLTYITLKDTLRAMQYLQAAQTYLLKRPQNRSVKYVYYAMGDLQKDLMAALPYYKAALQYDSTSGFGVGTYQAIGSVHYRLGDFAGAEPYYKKAEELGAARELVSHRIATYSALSSIYEQLGKYKDAHRYQVAYANLNDSLLNVENAKTVNQLELKYRTAEKDRQLAQHQATLFRYQSGLILTTACGVLLLAIAIIIWRSGRNKHKLQKERIRNFEQQQKIEQLHAKMQGEEEERSRIARELHDGVNVLLSATKMNYAALGKEYKGLQDTHSYGEVMQLLNHMGLELRTITYKLVPELLIRQSLPDALETFCELIQKSNNLHIELQTYGSFTALPSELCFGVYRIVQELVHNIVKHSGATQVLIALICQNDLLQLTVEDNGHGFDTGKVTKGLGLESMRSRVRDLGGQISFTSRTGEGTSVEIEVNITTPAIA
jgi:two-component system NarL family sensor kinase